MATKYRAPKNIKEKKIKVKFKKEFWRIFLVEGVLFLMTSILAVVSAFKLNKLIKDQKVYLPTISLQDFLFSFLLITFFVLLFIFFKKASKFKELIYKVFFLIVCFWGGMTVLNSFLPVYGAILIIGILIIMWLEFPSVWVHDALMVLGLAGAASFFGLGLEPSVVIILLVIFSFYDFIAVYKTKHMVAMANEMIEKKVILGFIIPKEFHPVKYRKAVISAKPKLFDWVKYFNAKLSDVKPGGNFLILGGGDVVFPNLLAVSVVPFGLTKAFIIVLFSLIGSLFSFWIFMYQKNPSSLRSSGQVNEPIPALPPVALLTIIGYFVSLLF